MTARRGRRTGNPAAEGIAAGDALSAVQNTADPRHAGSAAERVLEALEERGRRVQSAGPGRWRSSCPAHDGHDQNLAIAVGDQGVLVKCFSNDCTAEAIATSLGLSLRDLFDRNGKATYTFPNDHIVTRTRTTGDGKRLTQKNAPAAGELTGWWTPLGSVPITVAPEVHLAEGEKSADALVRLGVACAASWPGGAGGVGRVDVESLRGKAVVIVPDNDEPGQKAARRLVERLHGVAASVSMLRVPETVTVGGEARGGLNDPADLWVAGGTLDDLQPGEMPEGSAWQPVDLGTVLADVRAGVDSRPVPTILVRSDGQGLFYKGMVNGVHGESGSGKTWVVLYACQQEMEAGGHAVYVDFEGEPRSIVARLIALGATPDMIAERFHYVSPDTRFSDGGDALLEAVDAAGATLVVIDSTGEALALEGVQPNADEEVARFFRDVPRRIANRGPAVALVDHSPKANGSELWPIGSQRKRAAINGAQYYVEAVGAGFSRDRAGLVKLICAKDRHGHYARGTRVATMHVDPAGDDVDIYLEAPEVFTVETGETVTRPTHTMEMVSRFLEEHGEASGRDIRKGVKGKDATVINATRALVAEGFVTATPHRSIKPFRDGNHPSDGDDTETPPIRVVPGPSIGEGTGEPPLSDLRSGSREPLGTTREPGEPLPEDPTCNSCGKPLWSPKSIASGLCGHCAVDLGTEP